MTPTRAAFLRAVCALAAATTAAAALDLSTKATWNSNATNANRSADVIGALQLQAATAASARPFLLDRDNSLTFTAGASAEAWPRFDGLDQVAVDPQVAWRHKFGLGAFAPVFRAELTAGGVAARESERSGWFGNVRLTWQQRWEEGTSLAFTLEQSRHDARGAVFDRSGTEFAVEASRELAENWRGALGARWREGDVISYATPPRPDLVTLARVRTVVDTFGTPRVAYTLSARSLAATLELTRELNDRSSLTFGYEARTTERSNLRYVNHLVSTAFTRQF